MAILGTSSGTMKNVGTDRYITISGSKPGIGTTGSNFNFGASTGIYFRSGRYISRNGENISTLVALITTVVGTCVHIPKPKNGKMPEVTR